MDDGAPAEPAEAVDAVERAAASPMRLAALRAAIAAPAIGLLTTAAMGLLQGRWRGRDLLVAGVFSGVTALASAPATWAEVRLARAGRTGPGWALAAGLGATALAFVVALLAIFQALYAEEALEGDPARGVAKVTEAVERMWSARWRAVSVLLPLSVPVGVTALARVRSARLAVQVVVSLLVGGALAAYYADAVVLSSMERTLFGAAAVVLAAVLPPAAWLADRLDRRLWPPGGA